MSLKERFDRMVGYFTEDADDVVETQSRPTQVEQARVTTQAQPQVQQQAQAAPVREQRPMAQASGGAPVASARPAAQAAPARPVAASQARPATQAAPTRPVAASNRAASKNAPTDNITRLHERQRELSVQYGQQEEQVTIDVRYPRRYDEAPEIVDLLLSNESILIDFQYMTEVQARRCLDYLDGARTVLAGNLKKVASTMYLLTPVNVVVNVEDLRLPEEVMANVDFDFDMKRR